MNFNKFLVIFTAIYSTFISDCSSQVTLDFRKNDQYFVKVDGEKRTFNSNESFVRGFKSMAGEYLNYTNIKFDDNKICFENFICNKDTFSVSNYYICSLTLLSDWKFNKDIILNYRDNTEVYLPKIDLFNIKSLNINSNYCNEPESGMLHYRDLNKIFFNKKPISIKNLRVITPGGDALALLDVQTRYATEYFIDLYDAYCDVCSTISLHNIYCDLYNTFRSLYNTICV